MKKLQLSILVTCSLILSGCTTTSNILNNTENNIQNFFEPENKETKPEFVGYKLVDMKNAKNYYGYPDGYFQAEPIYTNSIDNVNLLKPKNSWYKPNQNYYESQIPNNYYENTKHDILGKHKIDRSIIKEYSAIDHYNQNLQHLSIGKKSNTMLKQE